MDNHIFENIQHIVRENLPKGGQAILFGSQARGDAKKGSDWDVLVIVQKDKLLPQDYDTITYPLTTLGWDLDVDINPVLYTQSEWDASRITPFYQNVQRDGIKIASHMALTDKDKKALINLELEKSERFLAQADKNKDEGVWDIAANRYYYACFHAVLALFIQHSITSHRHAGTLRLFGQHFVKTGIVPKEFGSFLNRMEQLRTKADYNVQFDVSEEDVKVMVEPAHSLIEKIKMLLIEEV